MRSTHAGALLTGALLMGLAVTACSAVSIPRDAALPALGLLEPGPPILAPVTGTGASDLGPLTTTDNVGVELTCQGAHNATATLLPSRVTVTAACSSPNTDGGVTAGVRFAHVGVQDVRVKVTAEPGVTWRIAVYS